MHSSLVADSAEDSPEAAEVSKVADFPVVSAGVSRLTHRKKAARCRAVVSPAVADSEAVLAAVSE